MTPAPFLAVLSAALLAQSAAPGIAAHGSTAGEDPSAAPAAEAPVRLQVRKVEPPALAGAATALSRAVRRLWERDEPSATRGNALLAQNDVPGALRAYDEAEAKVSPSSEAAAALALNRAGALLKQGAEEAPRALEQAGRALASADPATRSKAAYDAALALESAGKTEEAIAAYGRTLALDPDDHDAKVNLELLLRSEERKRKQPAPGPQDPQQKQQPQGDAGKDPQAKGEAPKKDQPPAPGEPRKDAQKPQAGEKPRGGEKPQGAPQKDPGKAQARQDEPDRQEPGGGGDPRRKEEAKPPDPGDSGEQARADARGGAQPLDRTEAQRLLDALRASEKNLQIWRFGKRTKDPRRRGTEKDW